MSERAPLDCPLSSWMLRHIHEQKCVSTFLLLPFSAYHPFLFILFIQLSNLLLFLLRFDASLTCPEPWSHANKSIKLLKVNVCHLTQFSFLWSFYAQNGLVLLDKNNSRKSVIVRGKNMRTADYHFFCSETTEKSH